MTQYLVLTNFQTPSPAPAPVVRAGICRSGRNGAATEHPARLQAFVV
ncbi:hypothetical protein [Alcanivorax quisquiliarum]|uniref:Uncharacterized protein n=1 Tax=Alcanivorax quisquiliarum TaxID=2933565 RepID=A0ABT0E8V8_9GAMM|nr:hypothetical protein [Alcanivorax quisquiliarum]MCK0538273.1 hypothetical protein [Alcanivorax quisquiliarum]